MMTRCHAPVKRFVHRTHRAHAHPAVVMAQAAQAAPQLNPASAAPSTITCAALLSQAAQDDTQVYPALLPAALRLAVDRLIAADAWRFAGDFTSIDLGPAAGSRHVTASYTTLSNGETVVCVSVPRTATAAPFTYLVRPDLAEGDARRVRSVAGSLRGLYRTCLRCDRQWACVCVCICVAHNSQLPTTRRTLLCMRTIRMTF